MLFSQRLPVRRHGRSALTQHALDRLRACHGISRRAQVGFKTLTLIAPCWARALVEALRGSLPRDAAGLRQVPGRRPLQEALGAAERLAENLRRDHEVAWGFMSTFTKTVRRGWLSRQCQGKIRVEVLSLAENLRRDHEVAWGFMSTFTKTVRVRGP